MLISSIAAKHGLVIARVASENKDTFERRLKELGFNTFKIEGLVFTLDAKSIIRQQKLNAKIEDANYRKHIIIVYTTDIGNSRYCVRWASSKLNAAADMRHDNEGMHHSFINPTIIRYKIKKDRKPYSNSIKVNPTDKMSSSVSLLKIPEVTGNSATTVILERAAQLINQVAPYNHD